MSMEYIIKPDGSKLAVDSQDYLAKVTEFEDLGLTTSDAQGAADVYFLDAAK